MLEVYSEVCNKKLKYFFLIDEYVVDLLYEPIVDPTT